MSNDPEELCVCPYDPIHMVARKRMQYHLMKCRKNFDHHDFKTCPFNARHVVPKPEFEYHVRECPDRARVDAEVLQRKRQKDPYQLKGYTDIPVSDWTAPEASECWDDDNVVYVPPSQDGLHSSSEPDNRVERPAPKREERPKAAVKEPPQPRMPQIGAHMESQVYHYSLASMQERPQPPSEPVRIHPIGLGRGRGSGRGLPPPGFKPIQNLQVFTPEQPVGVLGAAGGGVNGVPVLGAGRGMSGVPVVDAGRGMSGVPVVGAAGGGVPVMGAGRGMSGVPVVDAGRGMSGVPVVGAAGGGVPVMGAGRGMSGVPVVGAGRGMIGVPMMGAGGGMSGVLVMGAGGGMSGVPVVGGGRGMSGVPVMSAGGGMSGVPVVGAGRGMSGVPVVGAGRGMSGVPVVGAGRGIMENYVQQSTLVHPSPPQQPQGSPASISGQIMPSGAIAQPVVQGMSEEELQRRERKLRKMLRQIENLEAKLDQGIQLDPEALAKISRKADVIDQIKEIEKLNPPVTGQ